MLKPQFGVYHDRYLHSGAFTLSESEGVVASRYLDGVAPKIKRKIPLLLGCKRTL